MELKELNPELFSYELYNMAGCYQIDTALYCAESCTTNVSFGTKLYLF